MTDTVHLLTFTSLYPSASRARHGIFVESRLERLLKRGGVTARVVAPVPWFPFAGRSWGEYGRMAATPRSDVRGGIEVSYPRYPVLPRIGMTLQPSAMARAGFREVERLLRAGEEIDVVDAHYLYPDGVAAAEVARAIGRPLVLSARGSDVNVIAQKQGARARILHAIAGAAGLIAVSAGLRSALVGLGVPYDRITVLRNGVDAALFYPENKALARSEFGLPGVEVPLVASVGNLVRGKRHDLVIEAAARISGLHVLIVGRGPEHAQLQKRATELGLARRVTFVDEMPQARLRLAYSAADVLVLASEREGWPNVLLESAACGTPVVAFNVGGVPEILVDPVIGTIVFGEHACERLAQAIHLRLDRRPSPEAVREAAMAFSWEPVLDAQLALYRRVVRGSAGQVGQAEAELVRA